MNYGEELAELALEVHAHPMNAVLASRLAWEVLRWDGDLEVKLSPGTLTLLRATCGDAFTDQLLLTIDRMINRMITSSYKYHGLITGESVASEDWGRNVGSRWERFMKDGNTEWLVDIANFCVIMSTFACHPLWHFRATESAESPGIVLTSGGTVGSPADQVVEARRLERAQREGD